MWKEHRLVIVLILLASMGYGLYMLGRYSKIKRDSTRRASYVVRPDMKDGSVSEIGYIRFKRDELFLRDDNTQNLVWFVKVPSTGKTYSCSYERGFREFAIGDDVRIVRPVDLPKAGWGYVVGMHQKTGDRVALVWVNDNDELQLDVR